MILAASYSAIGMHAGQSVVHRQITGPQLWRLELEIDRPDGFTVTHACKADQPMLLRDVGRIANSALEHLAAAGEIEMRDGAVVARDVRWKARLVPKAGQRKAKRGRK